MRTTTKLKNILLKYSICIDMDDDGLFVASSEYAYHRGEIVFVCNFKSLFFFIEGIEER
jgi:hypothetical protein